MQGVDEETYKNKLFSFKSPYNINLSGQENWKDNFSAFYGEYMKSCAEKMKQSKIQIKAKIPIRKKSVPIQPTPPFFGSFIVFPSVQHMQAFVYEQYRQAYYKS